MGTPVFDLEGSMEDKAQWKIKREVKCLVKENLADPVSRGMNTVYIQRSTEDPDEEMDDVRKEVDLFIDGLNGNNGLLELARNMDS